MLCKNNIVVSKFPDNKVRYFAENAEVALEQISAANKKEWPIPVVRFHNSESFENERTIFDGWKSWHLGPVERFLF
jgi:hypothetical protein